MSWPVGTIVVCVDDAPPIWVPTGQRMSMPSGLVAGAYYTVASNRVALDGSATIGLAEPPRLTPHGCGWWVARFRLAESTHSEAGTVRAQEPVRA